MRAFPRFQAWALGVALTWVSGSFAVAPNQQRGAQRSPTDPVDAGNPILSAEDREIEENIELLEYLDVAQDLDLFIELSRPN